MSSTNGFKGVSNCYIFKSLLQEYAQKLKFPTPAYDTTKEGPSHDPLFQATVIVNDVRYDSLPGFSNRKAAEHSAAEVALIQLTKAGIMNETVAQPVHEMGLCKNLLQEYAQKMNYAIPLYNCQKNEKAGRQGLFTCTVQIGGIKYIGAAARTKKDAEIKAARTALLAIQSSGNGSSGVPSDNSIYAVTPCKKIPSDAVVISQESTSSLKPKRRSFKKKRKNKRDRSENKGNLEDQMGFELNQSDAVEDERSKGNEGEILVSYSKDAQMTDLISNQSDHENADKEINSMIDGGDMNGLMKEVSNNEGKLEVNMDNQTELEFNQSDAGEDERSKGNESYSNDAQLTNLMSNQSNQENGNKEMNYMIGECDMNGLMEEVSNNKGELGDNTENQKGPELNQSDAVEDERAKVNEGEILANNVELTALISNKSDQENANKEMSYMIGGGDMNGLMEEVSNNKGKGMLEVNTVNPMGPELNQSDDVEDERSKVNEGEISANDAELTALISNKSDQENANKEISSLNAVMEEVGSEISEVG